MTDPANTPVLIVGAGITGLAAGTWLAGRGYPVKILEASDRPGGRAITITRPDGSGDRVDAGTQYYHTNYRLARSLIREAGLAPRLTRVRGKTRFFDDRAPGGTFTTGHRIPTIRAKGMLGNLYLTIRGLARMARRPISPYAARPYPAIDALSVDRAMPDPFEHEFTARTLITAGALIEPGAGAGFDVSYLHLIRLMWIVLMTDYLVLEGGTDSLHRALAERLDVTYGAKADHLIWEDNRARGVVLADGTRMEATQVILATPPAATARLLPGDWQDAQQFLEAIPHPPAVIVTLFLDRALEPGVWSYIFRPDPARLVSMCVDAAQKCPAMVPSGRAALQAWICWPAAGPAGDMEDTALIEAVLADLAPSFPGLADQIRETHIQRHAEAVPQSPPGHAEAACGFLAGLDQRAGVEICGDFLSGGYMESALWSAHRAITRIDGDHS